MGRIRVMGALRYNPGKAPRTEEDMADARIQSLRLLLLEIFTRF